MYVLFFDLTWVYTKLHSLVYNIIRLCGICESHIWVHIWSAFDQNIAVWDNNEVKNDLIVAKKLIKTKDKRNPYSQSMMCLENWGWKQFLVDTLYWWHFGFWYTQFQSFIAFIVTSRFYRTLNWDLNSSVWNDLLVPKECKCLPPMNILPNSWLYLFVLCKQCMHYSYQSSWFLYSEAGGSRRVVKTHLKHKNIECF